ncbi:MAG: putative toxin-antitoxin system toxin component, PIN family [Microcystis sp. M048S1]|uniref:putative toxin-antitoxin system toxin component, PIN family n=1 Tax=unclassified Microcystis TaxID=2643300 RepID=UPI001196FD84|nr:MULTISPECIES: putative toxin-antitoxin system toxin component, PIN family [unclassified Microcystis]MCA2900006.1 putative toxin-antitoxin system toxin component, PIN family [Microcystis sp. M035S1]MCA2721483.1 putative toxin-antitoxin system toxin component, PIN family [Microcystis sp. M176S2]MCA2724886.1 putative toxin-antitoxin system toxin component, PIN family [Microcystis sp. M166S2]MCA2729182.1 putative toxin-antitoxin system toxin component, PIN family [Microcystis sp. M162S2]MCA2746
MDNKPPIKVIIDTNLWISFLIGKQLAGLKYLLIEKTLVPIFSPQLLNEINLVTKRPKLQKHFPQSKVQELLELLSIIGLCIETKSKINICRNAKDNYLLALAKDSQADFLITGDQHLLILQQFGITKIVTYQQFLVICRLG